MSSSAPAAPAASAPAAAAAATTSAAACLCKRKRGQGESKRQSLGDLDHFEHDKAYKVYIVLHGQGIRASPESSDEGYIYTGTDKTNAPNFYTVPEKTQVFRMVPPGHVFMSHIDINVELRNFFGINLDDWIQTFTRSTTLNVNPGQAAAHQNHESVDPEHQPHLKSRAIFNKMLQLFVTGDQITNERLETDYDSREAIEEFGIWIAHPDAPHAFSSTPVYSAVAPEFLDGEGNAKEITLGSVIDQIRKKIERGRAEEEEEPFIEFYVANCSPVSQDKSAKKRLVRKDDGTWQREGEYGANYDNSTEQGIENKKFWKNTLSMYNKRIKLYHNGNARLEQLKEKIGDKEGTPRQFPQNDTVWGMMDDEERQDNYKLMSGFLTWYPQWIKDAESEEEKQEIRDDMIFYIQCISTPFTNPIRGGSEHQQGISQITKHIKPTSAASSSSAAAVEQSYYTLSEELKKKIDAKIRNTPAESDKEEYENLISFIYGEMGGEKRFAYRISKRSRTENRGAAGSAAGTGGAIRKRRRKTRKKRRRKRRKKTRRKKLLAAYIADGQQLKKDNEEKKSKMKNDLVSLFDKT